MTRRHLVALVTCLYATAWACGGRNLDAGPQVIVIDDDGAAGGSGGFGGGIDPVGGMGGDAGQGGQGAAGAGGTGGTGGGPMPIECLACIGIECPQALDCVTDQACIQGVICAVGQCLGGGGTPDFMCLLDCFDGDIDAALIAVDTLTCVFGSCADACGGLLPFP
jgi:hypothetical protein